MLQNTKQPSSGTVSLSRWAKVALGLESFLSISALGGGLALILGPRGEFLQLDPAKLEGSMFDSYLIPGLALYIVLGLGPLAAIWMALRRNRWASAAAIALGGALLIFMAVEIAVVGYTNSPPLQPIYLTLAFAILAVGVAWRRSKA